MIHEGHAYTAEVHGEEVILSRDGAAHQEETRLVRGFLLSDCRDLVEGVTENVDQVKSALEQALVERVRYLRGEHPAL